MTNTELIRQEIDKILEKAEKDEKKAFARKDVAAHLVAVTKTAVAGKIKNFIDSLQQGQPIEGRQVIIITETNGNANIHWDCRSLDDVKALLASAQSFITDKQVEELRGIGSGPDYNTTEGRFRNADKFQQEQPEHNIEEKAISLQIQAYLTTASDELYAPGKPLYTKSHHKDIHDCMLMWQKLHQYYFSAKQGQPEVDLEKEVDRFLKSEESTTYENAGSYKVAVKDPKKIARHFYELGLNAKKRRNKLWKR